MPAIIPIPAFSVNYIWLVREGARGAAVDPGDAEPVLDYLDRERLELTIFAIDCLTNPLKHVSNRITCYCTSSMTNS